MRANEAIGQSRYIIIIIAIVIIIYIYISLNCGEKKIIRKGVNMVTCQSSCILKVLSMIQLHNTSSQRQDANQKNYPCPFCGMNLPLQYLSSHVSLFHTQESTGTVCSVCKETVANFPKHLQKNHFSPNSLNIRKGSGGSMEGLNTNSPGGGQVGDLKKTTRQPVFILTVVRRPKDGKFLMVDEVASQVNIILNCPIVS